VQAQAKQVQARAKQVQQQIEAAPPVFRNSALFL
jgi:hypothetical protein